MTPRTLADAMNIPLARAEKWQAALDAAMASVLINTPKRRAAFLAQIGHESGGLYYVRELGNDAYFAKYDGRKDLGNTQPGDGPRFRGRGLIQVTGRANYAACSRALFGDERLLEQPELLEQPQWAAESAAWFWMRNNLNSLADGGMQSFTALTRRINGGTNGLDDRQERYKLACRVLGV